MILKNDPASLFMGNYFCRIESCKTAFVAISKNAVTTLKNVAIYNKLGFVPREEIYTHSTIGYSSKSEYLYTKEQLTLLEQEEGPILKFAVWRDPVERLVSCYKFFCLERNDRYYFRYLDLFRDNSFDRFMEFVAFELRKSDPLYQDEHIRKQSDYYNPTDVDYIVPIHKLEQFLQEHRIPFVPERSNQTKVRFDFPRDQWEKQIKELYAADYDIQTNYG